MCPLHRLTRVCFQTQLFPPQKVVYDDNLLRMYLDGDGSGWQECFILRSVHLPASHFFGFTAATGDLADNHDIITFKLSEPGPMSEEEAKDLRARIENVSVFLVLTERPAVYACLTVTRALGRGERRDRALQC